MPVPRRLIAAILALAGLLAAPPGHAAGGLPAPEVPACTAPPELIALGSGLPRTAARIAEGGALTIVAMGSSSTAGAGASGPDHAYPARLEAELAARLPGIAIHVLNRGVNGESAPQMLDRFDRDVFPAEPDLVIWQVGSNAVLHDEDVGRDIATIHDGVERLRGAGIDTVLMDPQYSPKLMAKPNYPAVELAISGIARADGAGLFRRFAIMEGWRMAGGLDDAALLAPDGVHMNDWSYGCLAHLLAGAILDAAAVHREQAKR